MGSRAAIRKLRNPTSWNVEHFEGEPARIERVVAFLGDQNPDVLALEEVGGKANFLFLGDLNTMGVQYPFDRDIEAGVELNKLDREARKVRMRHLTKNQAHTWWNGPGTRPHPPTSMMSWPRSS